MLRRAQKAPQLGALAMPSDTQTGAERSVFIYIKEGSFRSAGNTTELFNCKTVPVEALPSEDRPNSPESRGGRCFGSNRTEVDPKESRAISKSEAQEGPRIESVHTQEEFFDQEWCASLKQVAKLTFVKDEEVPRLECVPIKEEFIEHECVSIAEEVPTENNVCTLEENNKLGSSLCDDCPSECELGFRVENVAVPYSDLLCEPQCRRSGRQARHHRTSGEADNSPVTKHRLQREQGGASAVQGVQGGLWSLTSAGRVKKVGGDENPLHTSWDHSTLHRTMF
ncbi:UNVERIFIED_CONTAM: hypothetical protein FKN15_060099 [Acipenser sinensis]